MALHLYPHLMYCGTVWIDLGKSLIIHSVDGWSFIIINSHMF